MDNIVSFSAQSHFLQQNHKYIQSLKDKINSLIAKINLMSNNKQSISYNLRIEFLTANCELSNIYKLQWMLKENINFIEKYSNHQNKIDECLKSFLIPFRKTLIKLWDITLHVLLILFRIF